MISFIQNSWFVIHKYVDRLYVPGNGKNRIKRYGFVFILIIFFFFLKTILVTTLGKDFPFLFSLFIVIISAWFGGFGPGILATILSGIITYFFYLEPKYTIFGEDNIPNMLVIIVFLFEGIFISVLSESHRRSDIQKSEFLGVISHELKNPLTSIKGYAEMIQRAADRKKEPRKSISLEKFAEYAARIDHHINQVIEMINEMLDMTKIETGRLTYHDETFNFTKLVKEIISDQQVTTTTHKIQFANRKDIFITADKYRIGQVLTNLISNAMKYSPHAKNIIIQIKSSKTGVTTSVKDFGPGIAEDDQIKLFNPFFRAKKTQSAKGTGIGLFISYQIIKRHEGRLWVKSRLNKGSTFYFSLPLKNKSTKKYNNS